MLPSKLASPVHGGEHPLDPQDLYVLLEERPNLLARRIHMKENFIHEYSPYANVNYIHDFLLNAQNLK